MLASGCTQTALALRLQVNQSSVSSWLRRVSRPEHHHRIAIARISGIEEEAWLTDDERAVVAAAATDPVPATEPAPAPATGTEG